MADAFNGGFRVFSTGEQTVANYVWDTNTLSWTVMTASAGGGPSSSVTVVNASIPVTQAGSWTVAVTGPLTDTQLRATPVPVSGTFWQTTQPVSIASMPTTPVTGTFWQATQPVSIASSVAVTGPLTDTQLRATAVPVSGTVAVSNFPATQAVSGTFWQATQPVSIASMPSTPVTGTFWQATQPVSIASWTGLTDTQLRASAVPVSLAATVTTTEAPPTTVAHGVVSVTTAGTRVQFGTNACKSIVVKAAVANSGTIYVGGSTVAAANGFPLAAGDTVALDISNTNVIWIDASANAQSVAWMSNS